jgi:hypothetical protein
MRRRYDDEETVSRTEIRIQSQLLLFSVILAVLQLIITCWHFEEINTKVSALEEQVQRLSEKKP